MSVLKRYTGTGPRSDPANWVPVARGPQGVPGETGLTGSTGAVGSTGPQGPSNVWVNNNPPPNDTYVWVDTDDIDALAIPAGGLTGQVLSKIDGTDFNTEWVNPPTPAGLSIASIFTASTYDSGTNRPHFPDPYLPGGSIDLASGTGRVIMFFGHGSIPSNPEGIYHTFPFDPATVSLLGSGIDYDGQHANGGWWFGSNYDIDGSYRFPVKFTKPGIVQLSQSIYAYTTAGGIVSEIFTDTNSTYLSGYAYQGAAPYDYRSPAGPGRIVDPNRSSLGAIHNINIPAGERAWGLDSFLCSVKWPAGMPPNLSFKYAVTVTLFSEAL